MSASSFGPSASSSASKVADRDGTTRVLQLITLGELGGAQRYLAELARRQRQCGFSVDLACGTAGWLTDQPLFDHVEVIPSLVRPISPVWDMRAFLAIRRLIGRGRYDVVHTHSSKAGMLGRLAAASRHVKLVAHTSHGTPLAERISRPRRLVYRVAEQAGAMVTDRTFAVSETEARLLRRFVRHRRGALRVMMLVPEHVRRLGERSAPRERSKWWLVAVGNLYANKGYPELLRAVADLRQEYPSLRLTIYGAGPERETLERISHGLRLEDVVELAGASTEIESALANCGTFVIPSIKEGLPIVLLEAMAAGAPIVATNVGAIDEVLGGVPLVRPGDPQALADAIRQLLDDDDARTARAAAVRTAYEHVLALDSANAICDMYR